MQSSPSRLVWGIFLACQEVTIVRVLKDMNKKVSMPKW